MVTLKKFILLIIMSFGVVLSSSAQELKVVSTGQGTTEDEATKTALRSALEDAYGTFISSSTKIENDVLVSDEIVSLTQGNVKEYDVVNSSQLANGLYSVTVESVVSLNELATYCQSKGMSVTFNGKAFGMEIKMREFNRKNEIKILKNLCLQIMAMNPRICDYELKTINPRFPHTGWLNLLKWFEERNVTIYVPVLVVPKTTSNYRLIERFMQASIKAVAMTKSEMKSYKKINLYYYDGYLGDGSYFRNKKAIEIFKKFFHAFRHLMTYNWILKDGIKENLSGLNLNRKTLRSLGILNREEFDGDGITYQDFGVKIRNGYYPECESTILFFFYSTEEINKLQSFEIEPFNEEAYETIIKPKLLNIIAEFDNIE